MKNLLISIFLFFTICKAEEFIFSTLSVDLFVNKNYNPYSCPDIDWKKVLKVSFIDNDNVEYKIEDYIIIPSVHINNENGGRSTFTIKHDHNFTIVSIFNQNEKIIKNLTKLKISFINNGFFICNTYDLKISKKEILYDISVENLDDNNYAIKVENPKEKEIISIIPKGEIILFEIAQKGGFVPSDKVKRRSKQD